MRGFEKFDILTNRDERGWVSNLLDFMPIKPVDLKNVHIVSMEPGAVRGNHYHKRQVEALCVLGLKMRVKAVNRKTGESCEEVIGDRPPSMYVVQPEVSHAFRNESDQVSYLVCFTDTTYDFDNPDSFSDEVFEKE